MKKIIVALVFGFMGIIIAGCEKSDENTLVVGMECAYAPYNWTTSEKTDTAVKIDGTDTYCDGYDVKIAKEIANNLDKTLIIKALDFDGLIPALEANQIDAIIAGMSPTEKRKLAINFTDTYFRSEQVMVVKENSAYINASSINDFNGARVTAQLGTLQEGLVEQLVGALAATSLPDYPTLVTALNSNTVDGFIAELPVATQIIQNNANLRMIQFSEGNGFVVLDAEVTTAIGLRKSDEVLLNDMNDVLAEISQDQRNTWMNEFIVKSSS